MMLKIVTLATCILTASFSLGVAADTRHSLMDEALGLVSIGFDMAEYGSSSSTDDVVQCMGMMDEHQHKANELRDRVTELPYDAFQNNMELASIELRRCLSCIPDAISSCEDAEGFVDEAELALED
ncbi:hypothetical protein [Vreelandella sp. TE19]